MCPETLIVPGDLASLPRVTQFVREVCREAGLADHMAYRLRLAVEEIAVNIIEHGYGAEVRGQIHLSARLEAERLIVALEDSSLPFDPAEAPPPDLSLPPDERPIGGLGVYLARSSVDDLQYESGTKRNRTVFVVVRSGDVD